MNAPSPRIFNEVSMYNALEAYSIAHHLSETWRALSYAKQKHAGQVRKGKDGIPYIHHPLLVACHALALGFTDDTILAAALLHDVCEDCGVMPKDLPFSEEIKEIVALLTKTNDNYGKTDAKKTRYYSALANHPAAVIIKLLDRCNNISCMSSGFSRTKIESYIEETEKWFCPLLDSVKSKFPAYTDSLFLIQYHMMSVLESIKYQL